jgi:hypothetical protein
MSLCTPDFSTNNAISGKKSPRLVLLISMRCSLMHCSHNCIRVSRSYPSICLSTRFISNSIRRISIKCIIGEGGIPIPCIAVQWLTILFRFREVSGSNSARRPAIFIHHFLCRVPPALLLDDSTSRIATGPWWWY